MSRWRIAGGVAVLFCFLGSVAAGADLTYSGVPGKWKKGAKGANAKAYESETQSQEGQKGKDKNVAKVTITRGRA